MIRELRFDILYKRHCDEVFRYALVLVGNRADAEEITQEALLRLWKNLDQVRWTQARSWIYTTTRNLCLDLLRRRASRSAPLLVSDETLSEHPDDSLPEPGLAADGEFARERLASVLIRMPERLRSVLVLYEVNGLRYREIAEALDLPINTVKVTLLRARAKFRDLAARKQGNHEWTQINTN